MEAGPLDKAFGRPQFRFMRSLCPFSTSVLLALWLGSAPAHAQPAYDPAEAPAWRGLKACLDRTLADLIPSREPVATISKAVEAVCESDIAEAAKQALRDMAIDDEKPIPRRKIEEAERFIRGKIGSMILPYSLKFKAKGGPTTLTD